MKQFDLSLWLKDKSRKVVTRDRRPVRIVCWDRPGFYPIIGYTEDELNLCFSTTKSGFYCKDGAHSQNDIFFADEKKEELTEFDYAVLSIISDHNSHTDSIEAFAKRSSKKLLDLARKEILKDFPKWKKAKENRCLPNYAEIMNEDGEITHSDMVCKGEYFIMLQSLGSLPKEE